MNTLTDAQLLRDYSEQRSEAAFAELVRRYVDLVHSAALRMVRDGSLAQDVTQGVFVALAQNSRQLTDRAVLAGWLHRTAQNIAAQTVRSDVRRRAREQEAAAMNDICTPEADPTWKQLAPHLDEALGDLSEEDRDALMLRYFQSKSAREIATLLATSEEAAQKRVNRAVERLRGLLAKRGVTIGAGGLVVIASNAVQAAPAGMAAMIASSAALTATSIAAPTAFTLTKAIAMTTFQKSLIALTLTTAVGVGIYEGRQAADFRRQVQTLKQAQAPLTEQLSQLLGERDDATNRLAMMSVEIASLRSNTAELTRLRNEVQRLREPDARGAQSSAAARDTNDPFTQSVLALSARALELNSRLEQMPNLKIPEMQLLDPADWLRVAKDAKLDTDAGVRDALRRLRILAKDKLPLGSGLFSYVRANSGQLPTDLSQMQPYLRFPVDQSTLARYTLIRSGNASDVPAEAWVIIEKAPVDKDYDSREKFGIGTSTHVTTGIGENTNPEDADYGAQ